MGSKSSGQDFEPDLKSPKDDDSELTSSKYDYSELEPPKAENRRFARQLTTKKYKVYMEDLETIIYEILYFQVPIKSQLGGKDMLTLIEFLKTCSIFFPESNTKVRKLVKGILDDIKDRSSMTIADFEEVVRRHNSADPITGDNFVTCKDDEQNVACGLWLLFNTFTTQAYVGQGKEFQDKDDVLTNIANYISYFNPAVAPNIQADSASFPYGLRESVLWLWKVENEARNREFPDATLCPECHNSDGSWNDDKLVDFILSMHKIVFYTNGSVDELWE